MNRMSSTASFCALTVSESPLFIKMSFLRKYFGAVGAEFLLMSVVCTIIMLSPLARFYVTENMFLCSVICEKIALHIYIITFVYTLILIGDWLLFLCCFLFCASYLSLIHFIKLPIIDLILMLHILVQAFAVSVLVTFNDFMFLYQGIIMTTCTILGFILYTLQSKWNLNVWIIIIITCICVSLTSASLRALFGGTKEENILSILTSFFIILYHTYAIFKIIITLTPADFTLALINVHLLPVNWCVFSSLLYKP